MADLPAKPASRKEEYLSSIAGLTSEVPPCPYSREEAYLDAIDGKMDDIEREIDELKNNPDVVDIVDTYADLEAYDTSKLGDKDIIRVLNDETHSGESTYYRYDKATGTWNYIGSTGPKGGEQSDWAENDSTDPAYIKNRTHYEETVENTVAQYGSTSAGATPDSGYVWFVEKVEDYALSDVLDVEDGDIVYVDITFSVNGVERTDGAKFEASVENGTVSLDSTAEAGNRWRGAYASELDGDTTFRFPVASSDSSATVYITGLSYRIVKELDAKYIPVDGDTVKVNADGKLEADVQGGPTVVQTTGTSTTDVMSQNAVTSRLYRGTNIYLYYGDNTEPGYILPGYAIAIGNRVSTVATGNSSIAMGLDSTASAAGSIAIGGASARHAWSVAIGGGDTSVAGEFHIGNRSGNGYNSSNYRLLTGLYDPQSAHDAATKGYVDGLVGDVASALNVINNGTGA